MSQKPAPKISKLPFVVTDLVCLAAALSTGHVHSAALEVFETEPLPTDSPLRSFAQCLFGSHNASNTVEAVQRTSERAMESLFNFLQIK